MQQYFIIPALYLSHQQKFITPKDFSLVRCNNQKGTVFTFQYLYLLFLVIFFQSICFHTHFRLHLRTSTKDNFNKKFHRFLMRWFDYAYNLRSNCVIKADFYRILIKDVLSQRNSNLRVKEKFHMVFPKCNVQKFTLKSMLIK